MDELYYAPTAAAAPITLAELRQLFLEAGLPCELEPDSEETCWIAFEPHETSIYAGVIDGKVTLATLGIIPEDDPRVLQTIEKVMQSIHFSADEDED